MGEVVLRTSGGKPITAHTATLADFFYWINERHSIYLKKERGDPKPWTADPILQRYKFTNAFRQLDRGTVWLTENVIKPHAADPDQAVLLFNIILYRMFNWWPTGEYLGYVTKWDGRKTGRVLQSRVDAGVQVFTGAHILRSENGIPKVESHMKILDRFWIDREALVRRVRDGKTMERAFHAFLEYPYIGDFLAYEFVCDLRWTPILEATDRMTWANAGPGAIRGVLRLAPTLRDRQGNRRTKFLDAMRALLAYSQRPGVLGRHVPPLEMREIEHSLCEFDKYWRAKMGEGRPRSMYPGV